MADQVYLNPDWMVQTPTGQWVTAGAWSALSGAATNAQGQVAVSSDANTALPWGGTATAAGAYYFQNAAAAKDKPPDKPADQAAASNAQAHLREVLDGFGLGSLADWAYGLLAQGYGSDYILQELRNRPEFKARFPAIAIRQAKGLTPISLADYVALERSYDEILHATGLTGYYERNSTYTNWIGGDVSPSEVKARADLASQAAFAEPVEVRAELQRLYGPSSIGVATAYFLDPTNSLPEAQRRLQSSEIGGGSLRAGYGLLTRDEAERLAAIGVNADSAQQGFGKLAGEQQLFAPLPGEQGQTIGRQEQLAAEFEGNAQDQLAIQQQAAGRKAVFGGGYGYQSNRTGVSGIGEAR